MSKKTLDEAQAVTSNKTISHQEMSTRKISDFGEQITAQNMMQEQFQH
jgi:hypothetical protein